MNAIHTKSKAFPCHRCSAVLYSKPAWRQHVKHFCESIIHNCPPKRDATVYPKEKKHSCQYCEMKFVCPSSLKIHMRTHTVDKPYFCTFCQKSFAHKYTRDEHVNAVHTKSKAFPCSLCSVVLYRKSNLNQHVKETHTN